MNDSNADLQKLSDEAIGKALLTWDQLNNFVQRYAVMLLRSEPLPAEAARELALLLQHSSQLKDLVERLGAGLFLGRAE